jgi:hypothetical protein
MNDKANARIVSSPNATTLIRELERILGAPIACVVIGNGQGGIDLVLNPLGWRDLLRCFESMDWHSTRLRAEEFLIE